MTELLHAWALVPATVGACCVAADRGRPRMPELVGAVLMVLAMADAAVTGIVAPVWWAAILVVAGMGLAALRSPRRRGQGVEMMTVLTAVGLVVTAGLLLGMGSPGAAAAHAHGGGALWGSLLALAAAAHVGASALAATQARSRLDRGQYAAMGAATLLMGMGLIA